jgi:Lon protease-like protein
MQELRSIVLWFCAILIKQSTAFTLSPSSTINRERINIDLVPTSKAASALFSSSSADDDFMASLRTRVDQVEKSSTKIPLVVLDSMLPRQVLPIKVRNKLLVELVVGRLAKENPTFGMLGMARLSSGETVHLNTGVEVEIVGKPEFFKEEEGGGMRLVLRAGRRFSIQGEVENAAQGWTEARVIFLDAEQEEDDEVKGKDRMAVARAMVKSKELTSPNMNMDGNLSLVDSWIHLAKLNERSPGQINRLLEQLGEIPSSEEPSERAFWIGALINPIPAMGVATEIRPDLLTAQTAEERITVALDGILKSIRHMDGSAKMF